MSEWKNEDSYLEKQVHGTLREVHSKLDTTIYINSFLDDLGCTRLPDKQEYKKAKYNIWLYSGGKGEELKVSDFRALLYLSESPSGVNIANLKAYPKDSGGYFLADTLEKRLIPKGLAEIDKDKCKISEDAVNAFYLAKLIMN